MANSSLSTHARKNVLTGRRDANGHFKPVVLKTIFSKHGFHEIYLGTAGSMKIRRHNGTAFGRAYDAVDMKHAIELAKSGALAADEARLARVQPLA